jgi:hypothetical protein
MMMNDGVSCHIHTQTHTLTLTHVVRRRNAQGQGKAKKPVVVVVGASFSVRLLASKAPKKKLCHCKEACTESSTVSCRACNDTDSFLPVFPKTWLRGSACMYAYMSVRVSKYAHTHTHAHMHTYTHTLHHYHC